MIEHLDRARPFGRISGQQPQHCDRPPAFEQDGKLFDVHGRLIVPGEPFDTAAAAAEAALAHEEAAEAAALLEAATAEALADKETQARSRVREKRAQMRQAAEARPSVISPFFQPPEFDRPAHYEWRGKYLDEHGREIEPRQPLTPERLAAMKAEEADTEGLQIAELIAKADTLALNVLLAAARTILAPCPRGVDQIVQQLKLLAKKQPRLRVPRVRT